MQREHVPPQIRKKERKERKKERKKDTQRFRTKQVVYQMVKTYAD